MVLPVVIVFQNPQYSFTESLTELNLMITSLTRWMVCSDLILRGFINDRSGIPAQPHSSQDWSDPKNTAWRNRDSLVLSIGDGQESIAAKSVSALYVECGRVCTDEG